MNEQIKRAAASRTLYQGGTPRTQRDVIRDVMLAAADCGTWLTLEELHALTKYGAASISAQLRHLNSSGYRLMKRKRKNASRAGTIDGRGAVLWEYSLTANKGGNL